MSQQSNQETSEDDETDTALLTRVRELTDLQQQLEGLAQFTAHLQAAVTRSGGPDGQEGENSTDVQEREDAEDDDDDDGDVEIHPTITCDNCHRGPPLVGRAMHCADCEDFDLCARCFEDLESLNHARDHQFYPRRQQGRRAVPSQLLMQMLENAMLGEALRRSVHGENDPEEEAARNEARGRELLAKLPRQPWLPSLPGVDSQGGECALCLEEYVPGEVLLKLPCDHYFHECCVSPWFHKSLLCPLCQQPASTANDADGTAAETTSS